MQETNKYKNLLVNHELDFEEFETLALELNNTFLHLKVKFNEHIKLEDIIGHKICLSFIFNGLVELMNSRDDLISNIVKFNNEYYAPELYRKHGSIPVLNFSFPYLVELYNSKEEIPKDISKFLTPERIKKMFPQNNR